MSGTVLSVSSRAMLDACARLGLDTAQILEAAVSRVCRAIETELRGGSPKLETVARQLAISPRTLQR